MGLHHKVSLELKGESHQFRSKPAMNPFTWLPYWLEPYNVLP